MHPIQRKFGRVLRRRRESSGLSQEALAERAGLHRNSVGLMERGQRTPTLIVLEQLAGALGCSMAELIGAVEWEPDDD